MRTRLTALLALAMLMLAQLACSLHAVIDDATDFASNGAAEIDQVTAEIVGIDIPGEYDPQVSLDVVGTKMAIYSNGRPHSAIILVQVPEGFYVNDKELVKVYHESMQKVDSNYKSTDSTLLEEQTVNVDGQEVVLQFFEGYVGDHEPSLGAMVFFEGKGGRAMLAVGALAEDWDRDMVDALVASME